MFHEYLKQVLKHTEHYDTWTYFNRDKFLNMFDG